VPVPQGENAFVPHQSGPAGVPLLRLRRGRRRVQVRDAVRERGFSHGAAHAGLARGRRGAVRRRAGRSQDGPAKDDIFKANEEAAKRFQQELLQGGEAAAARDYLQKRALDLPVWQDWSIGYAPEGWGFLADKAGPRGGAKMKVLEAAGLLATNEKGNLYDRFRGRVMFTIRDELGRAVGFSGRILKADDKAGGKYVNTPETPVFRKSRILFGLDKAKREILDQRKVLLVEGQIDCIRCHLAGFRHTVASQGTAFTEEHARLIKRYADHAVIVLDADAAGRKAALRGAELLLAEGLAVSLAALPPGEDPDSLILKGGAEALAAVLNEAKTPMGFLLAMLRAGEDLRTQEGLLRATRAVLELAAHAQGSVQAEQMLREAAAGLNVGADALQRDLRRVLRQKYRAAPPADAGAPVALDKPAARPVDEVELAMLLGAGGDPELAGLVRRWLPYGLITDPDCRAVIHALAEEEQDLMAALDDERESCKAFAAQIVNAPQKVVGSEQELGATKAAQDFIMSIWRRHLDQRRVGSGAAAAGAGRGGAAAGAAGVCRTASGPGQAPARMGKSLSDHGSASAPAGGGIAGHNPQKNRCLIKRRMDNHGQGSLLPIVHKMIKYTSSTTIIDV
jgi:DNA primase